MASAYFNEGSGKWMVLFYFPPQSKNYKSFDTEADARSFKDEIELDLKLAKKQGEIPRYFGKKQRQAQQVSALATNPPRDRFWNDYKIFVEGDHGKKTVDTYYWAWHSFTDLIKFRNIGELTPQSFQTYKKQLQEAEKAIPTINSYLKRLRVMFNWACAHGYLSTNPMIGVKNLVADERDPKPYLTREQIQKLCVEAANHSRDIYLFVCLCAYAGLRAAEALNCTWAWMQLSQPEEGSLKFYGGSITVQSGHKFRVKARQARTIPLHDTLRTVLENIEPKTGYLIKPEIVEWAGEDRWTYRKPLDTVLDRCGLKFVDNGKGAKRVGAHVLRHTFCSMLAQIGRSTYEIMQWAGHSDIKVSEGYMHLAPHKAGLSW